MPDITIKDGRETKLGGDIVIIDLMTSRLTDKPKQTVHISGLSQTTTHTSHTRLATHNRIGETDVNILTTTNNKELMHKNSDTVCSHTRHVASSTDQNIKRKVIDIRSSSPSSTPNKQHSIHDDIPSLSPIVSSVSSNVLHADDLIYAAKEAYTSLQLARQPDASEASSTFQNMTDVHRINKSHIRRSETIHFPDEEDVKDEGLMTTRTLSTAQALQIVTTVEVSPKSNRKRTLSSLGHSCPQEAITHKTARKRAH